MIDFVFFPSGLTRNLKFILAGGKENYIFGHPKRSFWTPAAHKRDMKFFAHLYFQHISICYVKMATSQGGGGGLHILSWDRA